MLGHSLLATAFASTAFAGSILWDGRFNDLTSSSDLSNWSWSNQVGPYQYYIHGSGAVTDYVNLSTDYKNPADTGSKQGAKISIDGTSSWNGQTMMRTELIPQTSAAINAGKVWYHFSVKRSDTNAPSIYHEHQVAFFESHFTELKYGWISGETNQSNSNLQWFVGGTSKWAVTFEPDVWHNVAYEIDFDAKMVAFYHSTGSDELTLTAGPESASTSSDGKDWHLGVLRLPRDGQDNEAAEDWYFSGVYVESDSLTTSVSHGSTSDSSSGSTGGSSSAVASSAAPASSSVAPASSSVAPASSSAAPASSSAVAAVASSSTPVAAATSSPVAAASSSAAAVPVSSSSAVIAAPSTFATVVVPSSTPVAATSSAAAPQPTAGGEEEEDDCE